MTPGEFIRARRKALGINAHELADAAELTLARIRAIEEGCRPDHWEAERLSAAIRDDSDLLADLLEGRGIDRARVFIGIDLASMPDRTAISAHRDSDVIALMEARSPADIHAAAARLAVRLGLR
ncbi:MAG: hypothetical protein RL490_127 [Pseudomonadota bacterium]|jgi:transcriptional regulator with XRE-family HTH domain